MKERMKLFVLLAVFLVGTWGSVSREHFSFFKFRDGEVSFTPAELPCPASIKFSENYTFAVEENVSSVISQNVLYMNNDVFEKMQTIDDVTVQEVYRSDHRFKEDGNVNVPVYYGNFSSSVCTKEVVSLKTALEFAEAELAYFTESNEFINVTDTECDGKPCRMYYNEMKNDEGLIVAQSIFYADKDDFVLGVYQYTNMTFGELYITMKVEEYILDNVPLEAFAIDSGISQKCEDAAYSVPEDRCDWIPSSDDSGDSGSGGSGGSSLTDNSSTPSGTDPDDPDVAANIKAALSLILVAVLVAFSALF